MAQVPTSSIKMSEIKAEVGVASNATLDAARAASVSYVLPSSPDIPNHTRDGNEQTNTTATPWYNTMAEWAGYTHSSVIGSPTYAARVSTATNTWALKQESDTIETGTIARAEGCITIWRTHDADNTYIKAKGYRGGTSGNVGHSKYTLTGGEGVGGGGLTLSTSTTGTTILTIPVGSDDISGGLTITATVSYLSGTTTSYTPTSPGEGSPDPDDITGTGALLLSCKGSEASERDSIGVDMNNSKFKVELSALKTNNTRGGVTYEDADFNNGTTDAGFVVHTFSNATYEHGF